MKQERAETRVPAASSPTIISPIGLGQITAHHCALRLFTPPVCQGRDMAALSSGWITRGARVCLSVCLSFCLFHWSSSEQQSLMHWHARGRVGTVQKCTSMARDTGLQTNTCMCE